MLQATHSATTTRTTTTNSQSRLGSLVAVLVLTEQSGLTDSFKGHVADRKNSSRLVIGVVAPETSTRTSALRWMGIGIKVIANLQVLSEVARVERDAFSILSLQLASAALPLLDGQNHPPLVPALGGDVSAHLDVTQTQIPRKLCDFADLAGAEASGPGRPDDADEARHPSPEGEGGHILGARLARGHLEAPRMRNLNDTVDVRDMAKNVPERPCSSRCLTSYRADAICATGIGFCIVWVTFDDPGPGAQVRHDGLLAFPLNPVALPAAPRGFSRRGRNSIVLGALLVLFRRVNLAIRPPNKRPVLRMNAVESGTQRHQAF
ncbi:hypothetical protein L1887_59523 [Cichorium endivia]|nr:hypothetical protein L1887_59523 [Cichorium endivia]